MDIKRIVLGKEISINRVNKAKKIITSWTKSSVHNLYIDSWRWGQAPVSDISFFWKSDKKCITSKINLKRDKSWRLPGATVKSHCFFYEDSIENPEALFQGVWNIVL